MIVALDIATRVGIAAGVPGGKPTAWSESLGEAKHDALCFSNALQLTWRLIAEYKPDAIYYEAAVGGPKTSHYLVGLVACVRGTAANRGIECHALNIGAIRKHFLGKHITSASFKELGAHRAKVIAREQAKRAVQSRCRALGWGELGEDAADAAAAWDFACALRGVQVAPSGDLFT